MLNRYECLRCTHKWIPRKDGIPKVCPKCHNPYWNVERKVSNNTTIIIGGENGKQSR